MTMEEARACETSELEDVHYERSENDKVRNIWPDSEMDDLSDHESVDGALESTMSGAVMDSTSAMEIGSSSNNVSGNVRRLGRRSVPVVSVRGKLQSLDRSSSRRNRSSSHRDMFSRTSSVPAFALKHPRLGSMDSSSLRSIRSTQSEKGFSTQPAKRKQVYLGEYESRVHRLRYSQDELIDIVEDHQQFAELQEGLRELGVVTNETLKQKLHVYIRNVKREREADRRASRRQSCTARIGGSDSESLLAEPSTSTVRTGVRKFFGWESAQSRS